MLDKIFGEVTRIIDGDTFDIKVLSKNLDSENEYSEGESIRIHRIDAPEIDSEEGRAAHSKLLSILSGKCVLIEVHARDKYGRVVGSIKEIGDADGL